MRRHPRGTAVDPTKPKPWATCDRCGLLWDHNRLSWQFDWRGQKPQNLRVLICPNCVDDMQRQLGTLILPPDPPGVRNARPEPYSIDEGELPPAPPPPAPIAAQPYVAPFLASILSAWQPIDPQPAQQSKLAPSIPGQSVDNPPFSYSGRRVRDIILRSWQPPAPPPTVRGTPFSGYVSLGATIHAAVADLSADKAAATYSNTTAGWDAESVDTDTFHDNTTANSRLTIPSSLAGRYGIITGACVFTSTAAAANVAMQILKNGSNTYDGQGSVDFTGGSNTFQRFYCQTQPVLLATGDYFEVALWASGGTAILAKLNRYLSTLSVLIVG